MGNALHFLINALFDLYLIVVLLRLWLQLVRADFYNPFSQFVVKATHPIIGPMRRILPPMGSVDTSSLLLAYSVAALKVFIIAMLFTGGIAAPLYLLTVALLGVIKQAIWIIIIVMIIRAIMSWFSQGRNPMELVLHQLTEPLSAPLRKIIPPIGGLDLSFLVLILLLQASTRLIPPLFPYF